MKRALALAARARGQTSPNPMVGALVVQGSTVAGEGFHARAGEPHAEINAMAQAGARCAGATLYCTLEPCSHHGRTPPCAEAVIRAGFCRVVAAMTDPNPLVAGRGFALLRAAGLEVVEGCLEREARRLNEFFVVFHERLRPFVTLKWAMTLDGRTGSDSNHSRWISNESSRRYTHELRALHDAVMIGIGTVLADDPILNVRLENYAGVQPMRIVIDTKLSLPRRAKLVTERGGGPVMVVTTPHAPADSRKALEDAGCRVVVLEDRRRMIDLPRLMNFLHGERLTSVFVEGGRQIQTTLLRHGAADKIVAFVAPKIIGGAELRSPIEDLGLSTMDQAVVLRDPRWRTFGEDVCLEGYVHEI